MTIRQYLMQALQEDARRAGERDRLLLEERRTRKARRERPDPAALGKAHGPAAVPLGDRLRESGFEREAAIMAATIKVPASRPVRRRRRRFPAPMAVSVVLVLAVTAALIFIVVWRGLTLA